MILPKDEKDYPWHIRRVFKSQKKRYGKTLAPGYLWGRLPRLFWGMLGMLWLFGRSRHLNKADRALVSARIAQLCGCRFCVDLNSYYYLQQKGEEAKAAAIQQWRQSELFSERDRAMLAWAEEVTQPTGEKSVKLTELKKHFDDDGVVELTAWCSFQNLSAKFNAALDVEEQGLCQIKQDE